MTRIRLPVAVATAAASALMPAGLADALTYLVIRMRAQRRCC
ncbi:hypothetical protein [Sphingomonas jatrophae]|uniref:Uncharacterized protein n=1 Tax=Sphingomonas jatrophae TaxID=1166337 RepID=A0A1I6JSP2_9SPHN|nr:hypothetical protein [Sphingomonas jatrophae]SFR82014.1 hypothetical protein SAMN05192580_0799 [Sphingomonas jatrophae]